MGVGGPISRVEVTNPTDFPSSGSPSGSVSVTNFPVTQPVSGSVSVSNFPASQPVTDAGGSLTIDTPQLPASLGAKTAAQSISVTPATDATYTTVDRGSNTIATGQVQVNNTTAVQVVAARAGRRSVTLAPSTQFTYFVGASGITAATGFAVLNGGAITLHTTSAVFVIAQSTGPMTFVETY
jgi:hypothetical protein